MLIHNCGCKLTVDASKAIKIVGVSTLLGGGSIQLLNLNIEGSLNELTGDDKKVSFRCKKCEKFVTDLEEIMEDCAHCGKLVSIKKFSTCSESPDHKYCPQCCKKINLHRENYQEQTIKFKPIELDFQLAEGK